MKVLDLFLDGRAAPLEPAVRLDGEAVWVPLHAFSTRVNAQVKALDGGRLAVCKGDLCIPLREDTATIDGAVYAPLAALGESLGLRWQVEENALQVESERPAPTGLGIGDLPPAFELPDLFDGEKVGLSAYRGKKAVFYLWASW